MRKALAVFIFALPFLWAFIRVEGWAGTLIILGLLATAIGWFALCLKVAGM